MEKHEILRFVRDNPFFFLATTENGEPRVRGMDLFQAGDDGIVFHTLTSKNLHKELIANPSVEMCFYSAAENRQLRIRGFVDLVEDPDLKEAVLRRYPFLAEVVAGGGTDLLAVYRVSDGTAFVWTPSSDRDPAPPTVF